MNQIGFSLYSIFLNRYLIYFILFFFGCFSTFSYRWAWCQNDSLIVLLMEYEKSRMKKHVFIYKLDMVSCYVCVCVRALTFGIRFAIAKWWQQCYVFPLRTVSSFHCYGFRHYSSKIHAMNLWSINNDSQRKKKRRKTGTEWLKWEMNIIREIYFIRLLYIEVMPKMVTIIGSYIYIYTLRVYVERILSPHRTPKIWFIDFHICFSFFSFCFHQLKPVPIIAIWKNNAFIVLLAKMKYKSPNKIPP